MLAVDIENSCSPEWEWMLLSNGTLGGIAISADFFMPMLMTTAGETCGMTGCQR